MSTETHGSFAKVFVVEQIDAKTWRASAGGKTILGESAQDCVARIHETMTDSHDAYAIVTRASL